MRTKQPGKLVDKVDNAFFVLAEWAIKWRLVVMGLALLLLVTGLHFAGKVRFDNSLESFFNHDDPAYIAYLEYLDDFVSDEVIYILYRAPNTEHGPFDLGVMSTIADLTETLEAEIPFAREATSLANVEFMRPLAEDEIVVDELLLEFPETQQALLSIKQDVLAKPMYIDYLVDSTATYAAIIVQMERSSTDGIDKIIYDPAKGEDTANLYPVVSDTPLREILARPQFANSGIEFYLSGDVPMNTTYLKVLGEDLTIITLATLVMVMVLSFLLFRATWTGLLAPVAVVLLSIVLTLALLGWLGWPINTFFTLVPTLVIAVGVAQSVHILLEYQRKLGESGDRQLAVKQALHKVGGPCLMAALTTAAGFWVMSFSELRGLAELGWSAPLGILATFVFSVTLLVVFMAGAKNQGENKQGGNKKPRSAMGVNPVILGIVSQVITINLRYPRRVMLVSGVLVVAAIAGLPQLRSDFNFLTEFKPHVEWRQHTEFIEDRMGGVLRMSYLVDTGRENGIKDPQLMAAIEKVQAYAETLPLVKKSYSLADVLKDLNQSFHNGDPAYYRIPEDPELLSQYLLLYEMSGGEELEEFVTYDFSRTVLEFQVEMQYATKIKAMLEKLDAFIAENPLPGAEARATGIGLLWVRIAEYIANTQLVSYSLVFGMIALFLCVSFGSLKIGLLSMIPNLAPVVFALGFLGWMGIPLDYMKLLLATIAIGIAVDDTLHLVTRYRSRFYEKGNYREALQLGLTDVGPALIVTSIILIVSFMTFLFSDTTVLASFGLLLGGTILVALLADLFLMPVLLMKAKAFGEEFEPESMPAAEGNREAAQKLASLEEV